MLWIQSHWCLGNWRRGKRHPAPDIISTPKQLLHSHTFPFLQDFHFPEGVALPLGGPHSPVGHVLIEVHYDNQQLVSGVVDSSGMEFFYTTQEPVHRAGVLSMGSAVNPIMLIPPQQEELIISGFCSASCLDRVSFKNRWY